MPRWLESSITCPSRVGVFIKVKHEQDTPTWKNPYSLKDEYRQRHARVPSSMCQKYRTKSNIARRCSHVYPHVNNPNLVIRATWPGHDFVLGRAPTFLYK